MVKNSIPDEIATGLRDYGVEVVFGLPGGESVHLIAALAQAGIQFVLVRHEACSAWMADGYSRIGRRLGVCLSTLGPGAANLAAGLAHCYLDRSPVLAITAQLSPELMDHHTHQRLDLQQIFAPVTKNSWAVHPEADIACILREAVHLARSDRPGPVRLEVPASLIQGQVKPGSNLTGSAEPVSHGVPRDRLQLAIARLQRARRPAILVGLGMEPSAPYDLLLQLAESLCAPVIVTPKAKGVLPEKHPLYAGVIGLEQHEQSVELLRRADLILAVGFDPVEFVLPWDFHTSLIFAAEFANLVPQLPAEIELIGDLGETLETLVQGPYKAADWSSEEIAEARPVAQLPNLPNSYGMFPSQIVYATRELLPDNSIVTCDVGSHKLLLGKLWPAQRPNRFLISNGLSTMGYALPSAIGAKMALPDVPVACFTGDGGMGMVVSELETAVRLRLPIVVIVLADQALSLIRLKQERAGFSPIGTLLGSTDWHKVAQGFGADGVVVRSVAELKAAVAAGLQADVPTLIEARTDASEYQSY